MAQINDPVPAFGAHSAPVGGVFRGYRLWVPSGRPGLAKAVIPALARRTVPASGFTEAGVPDVGTSGDTNLSPLNERRASIALDHR